MLEAGQSGSNFLSDESDAAICQSHCNRRAPSQLAINHDAARGLCVNRQLAAIEAGSSVVFLSLLAPAEAGEQVSSELFAVWFSRDRHHHTVIKQGISELLIGDIEAKDLTVNRQIIER